MNIRYLVGLFALGTMASAACGDDGADGTGGAGASGGSGGATSSSTSSAPPAGTGGQGGGGGTSGEGGAGGSAKGDDGASCTVDSDCLGGRCLGEAQFGFPGGYCSGPCDVDMPSCAGGGVCVDIAEGLCFVGCTADSGCKDAYSCQRFNATVALCAPACTDAAQCSTVGVCDTALGLCQELETQCDDGMDNDDDGEADCLDPNCATACEPALCATALPAAVGANTGDTTAAAAAFNGVCLVQPGTLEQIWRFTPTATGTISLTLASAADMGIYVRTDCASADRADELGCIDDASAGVNEVLADIPVTAGTPVFIFVDGFSSDDFGPYTLTIAQM